MRFGSLFSGIGGMDLGLERAGMECVWQVEIDDFCRTVLAKHWPNVPKFEDVRECGKHNLERVDLIAGGFPCQDVATVGPQKGIDGERSGLWREFHRIVCELRPRFILVENSPGLLVRGMGRVLRDLAESGHDAEWRVFGACEVGFPHTRERLFLLAYPNGERSTETVYKQRVFAETPETWRHKLNRASILAEIEQEANATDIRDSNGLSERVDNVIQALGNAIVPQVAQWIGERIISVNVMSLETTDRRKARAAYQP